MASVKGPIADLWEGLRAGLREEGNPRGRNSQHEQDLEPLRKSREEGPGMLGGHCREQSQRIPIVAEKMTMPSTFMPSLVPGSDL